MREGFYCDMCRRPFKDAEGVIQIVEGEFEIDTGGMATHGATDKFHVRCWNKIVASLLFYKVAQLETVNEK